jgi:hypothetical protein
MERRLATGADPDPMETLMRPNNRKEIPAMMAQLRRVMAELRDMDGKIPA